MTEKLSEIKKQAGLLQAVVGFDGYIDELYRVVEKGDSDSGYAFYRDIASFAARIAEAAGKSADIEIVPADVKLGGNAPIMANALSALGAGVTCIGAMGQPDICEDFREMSANCSCISVCDPARTYAFEYDDGKLMFGNVHPLDKLNWDTVRERVGVERIRELFDSCDLAALVNWSGFAGSTGIWEGILRDVLPKLRRTDRKLKFFFDLADPSKKTDEEINGVLKLIGAYGAYGSVCLGLNENEAVKIARAAGDLGTDPEAIAEGLYESLGIDAVIIHPVDRCIAAWKGGTVTEYGTLVEKPRITTGGGDNFNAGFCLGQMLGWDIRESMRLAMRVSGLYVKNGFSPTPDLL